MFSTLKMSSTQKIVMVFLHLKILSTWRIYTSVQVFSNFFIEELIPLCELTKIVFSILENGVNLKNICFCLSVFKPKMFFYLKNIHLCTSWLKWCILHWKIFKTSVIYIYHSAIIHLCDFSSLEVYTPPHDYTPPLFFLPEVYIPLWGNTPLWFFSPEVYNLCAIMQICNFLPKVYTLLCDYTPLWFFHLKYIHLCAITDFCDLS